MADEDHNENTRRTSAQVHRSKWPGWIWSVPIAALVISAWLVFRQLSEHHIPITIEFNRAAGLKTGTATIQYRGLDIGKVTKISLSSDGKHVIVRASMDGDVEKFLRAKTMFWLQGASPSLSHPASLIAVVAGPSIVMVPGGGKPMRHFFGIDHKPTIIAPPGALRSYVMSFDGAVGQLSVGAPVTLRGFTVGEVKQIGFRYDAATGMIETPVTIALDPSRFHIQSMQTNESAKPGLNTVLNHLIERGMRGLLVQNPPIIGSYGISLQFVPHASEASLDTSGPLPRIPTTSGGGVNSIIRRVNEVPIDQIAQNILKTTKHAESLVSSPQLRESLKHLNETLAGLNVTVHRTGPQVTRLVVSLRRTADSLRHTANQINRTTVTANAVLGGTPTSQDRNVRAALYELTQAARSIRSLANYLDRHPDALIRGRD